MGENASCLGGMDRPVESISLRDVVRLLQDVSDKLERQYRNCQHSLTARESLQLLTLLREREQQLHSLRLEIEARTASQLWRTEPTRSTTSERRQS